MTDINITRHGKWEVQVDGVVFSSHNEPKEGYENLIGQISAHPDKDVRLVPNFYVTGEIIGSDSIPFSLSEAQVEQNISQIPLFQQGKEYEYVLFEMDNTGLTNFSPVKVITIP